MLLKKIILLLPLFLTCFNDSSETSAISSLGFYLPPKDIIKKFESKELNYKEHFILGVAYKKNKNYKKSLLHFANSCNIYKQNLSLKIYPFPIYSFINNSYLKSEYYNNSVFEIANLFFLYKEFKYVIKFIDLIDDSEKALYRDAILLKSKALTQLKNYNDALISLEKILPIYEDSSSKSICQFFPFRVDLNNFTLIFNRSSKG